MRREGEMSFPGGRCTGDTGLDDLSAPRVPDDMVGYDAAYTQQEIRLQHQPADLHRCAVFGYTDIHQLVWILPGVVEHRYTMYDHFTKAGSDLFIRHWTVSAQRDEDHNLVVRNTGCVKFVQQHGDNQTDRGGTCQVTSPTVAAFVPPGRLVRSVVHRMGSRLSLVPTPASGSGTLGRSLWGDHRQQVLFWQ